MASIFKTASGWRAQIRLAGKPTTSKTFPSRNEAQRWARAEEHRLANSRSDNPHATFDDVMDIYLEHTTHIGENKDRVIRRVLRPYWGSYRMTEITSGAVAKFAASRKRDGLAPSSILTELAYLGVVLGHGGVLAGNREAQVARLELRAAISSLRHTGTVSDSRQRNRRPTEEELARLVDFFDSRRAYSIPMTDVMWFAISTCLRLGEIAGSGGIRVEDVDSVNRTLLVRGRKDPHRPNGRDDIIPLVHGHVVFQNVPIDPLEIIKRQPAYLKGKGLIFPATEQAVGQAFHRACEKLQICDLRFHDLRHDGISRLFEAKYDIPRVAAISGHRTWKNLQRYTHLKPDTIHRDNRILT